MATAKKKTVKESTASLKKQILIKDGEIKRLNKELNDYDKYEIDLMNEVTGLGATIQQKDQLIQELQEAIDPMKERVEEFAKLALDANAKYLELLGVNEKLEKVPFYIRWLFGAL